MKRHHSRVVTRGFAKLASAVKDGATQEFWYYMWIGSKWCLFDIRKVAKRSNHTLPRLMSPEELEASKDVTLGYEILLQRDLETVALWCVAIDAHNYIGR